MNDIKELQKKWRAEAVIVLFHRSAVPRTIASQLTKFSIATPVLFFHLFLLMATPVIVGVGAITAALVGRHLMRSGIIGKRAADQWVKGGFKAKMDRKEAIAVLGLKDGITLRNKLKDAHRHIMLANHPDRGGSPYMASKINEAKDLLDKTDGKPR
ncbi:hypothetical protein DFH29DRAFT_117382 [Suillus ampliporus]|nr:hypothetical protein DFH29DRAFT_117382 [Suillus ampliporus]